MPPFIRVNPTESPQSTPILMYQTRPTRRKIQSCQRINKPHFSSLATQHHHSTQTPKIKKVRPTDDPRNLSSNPRYPLKAINVTKAPPEHKHSPTRVFGHGVDIAHIPRFVGTIQKFSNRFYKKALHPVEITAINSMLKSPRGSGVISKVNDIGHQPPTTGALLNDEGMMVERDIVLKQAQFLASRWALKEALIKASGKRLLFPEIYISRDATNNGDPRAQLFVEGNAKEFFRIANLTAQISISHDGDYCMASVTLHQHPPYIDYDDDIIRNFRPGEGGGIFDQYPINMNVNTDV